MTPTLSTIEGITTRWLDPDEFGKIVAILEARGWSPIEPGRARVLVKEIDGQLIGFNVIQLFPHAEPLWITAKYRGTRIADDLAAEAVKYLRDNHLPFEATADSPHAEKLCIANGMELVPSPVYRDKIRKDT